MNNKMALLLIMLAGSHIVTAQNSQAIAQSIDDAPISDASTEDTADGLDLGTLGIDMDNFDPENQEQMDAFLKALEKNPEALQAIQSAAEESEANDPLENEIEEAVEAEAAAEKANVVAKNAAMVADEAEIAAENADVVAENELDDVVDLITTASQE